MDRRENMIAAILQPGYIPWLGFYEQMQRADVFVVLDDVQYTKNDWRNRNRIKTKEGVQWLTVPVSFEFGSLINETQINNSSKWARKHMQAIRSWYGKSPYFELCFDELHEILNMKHELLLDLDMALIKWSMDLLGIETKLVMSSSLDIVSNDRQLRLIEICKAIGCDSFYEGKSGMNYMDTELFADNDVSVEFQQYIPPYYNQLWQREQGFVSHLSVIDLLFNHGSDSLDILMGSKNVSLSEGVSVRSADDV